MKTIATVSLLGLFALAGCGGVVDATETDAGPLCSVSESTMCPKGVAAFCKAGGDPGSLWTLVSTDETSETTWCQEPVICHADVPEGATANQWLPCWEDAGPATGCYGNQSDCKVGQSCVITNFKTTSSGYGYCY